MRQAGSARRVYKSAKLYYARGSGRLRALVLPANTIPRRRGETNAVAMRRRGTYIIEVWTSRGR